jgi:hypothetical protein
VSELKSASVLAASNAAQVLLLGQVRDCPQNCWSADGRRWGRDIDAAADFMKKQRSSGTRD